MPVHVSIRSTWRNLALCASLMLLGAPSWAQNYQVEDLGTLGGDFSAATGINSFGHVAGNARTGAGRSRAFIWIDGVMRDLGTAGGTDSSAGRITNSDRVVGSVRMPTGLSQAVLWAPEYTRLLGMPYGADFAAARDMNESGVIAGWYWGGDDLQHIGLWTPEGVREGPIDLVGEAVNASGHVVGWRPSYHAILWRGHEIVELATDLPAPDRWCIYGPMDLNASDQVVLNSIGHAWRWTDGRIQYLGGLGSGPTVGEAINDAGAVVGSSNSRAFLYTDAEGIVDLNSRLGYGSGWVLQSATDINNAGQIVGVGLHYGRSRAFRLTPLPVRHGQYTPVSTYP